MMMRRSRSEMWGEMNGRRRRREREAKLLGDYRGITVVLARAPSKNGDIFALWKVMGGARIEIIGGGPHRTIGREAFFLGLVRVGSGPFIGTRNTDANLLLVAAASPAHHTRRCREVMGERCDRLAVACEREKASHAYQVPHEGSPKCVPLIYCFRPFENR